MQRFGDLHRELSGGHEHHGNGEATTGTRLQALQNWQRERCGLAGSGRCLSEEVMALNENWDRSSLNGGGFFVAQFAERLEELGAEPEIGEGRGLGSCFFRHSGPHS